VLQTTELRELFKKNIVMDIDELTSQTSRTRNTVYLYLKQIGYITSYNHNAKYYTLPEIACFDKSGIFDHKGILFFKDGGIKDLVLREINSSENGYTVEELSTKIKTRVNNQLTQFAKKDLIARRKYSDFYVYYSIDESIQQKQISNREKELDVTVIREESETSDEKKTIRILLEIIKNPDMEPQEMGKRLREEGSKISDTFIQNIFYKYDIQKKGSPSHF